MGRLHLLPHEQHNRRVLCGRLWHAELGEPGRVQERQAGQHRHPV